LHSLRKQSYDRTEKISKTPIKTFGFPSMKLKELLFKVLDVRIFNVNPT
jgi:hypothetical protein